jgi:DNA-binding GntR family transcriptional regulator
VRQGKPLLFVYRIAYPYRDTPMEPQRGYYRTDRIIISMR